jgi:crotonobetainyl-CoA:carnitine CoA-transferase CaiB-like acyl-CoA transferase
MKEEITSMLGPYRVLDLTNEWGILSGRLMADLGCDVIKIEPPCGDALRNIGPFFNDTPDAEESLVWLFYNANKRGITLNIESADGKEILKKLVKKTDFLIESFQPGYMKNLGLDYSELSKINPRLIMASITPFGQTGPYSHFKSADIVSQALCGWMSRVGDADRAPLQIGVPFQSMLHASAQSTAGMLLALYSRRKTGEGQQINGTPLPWMVHFGSTPLRYFVTKHNEGRSGQAWEWSNRPSVKYVWPCKDGHVSFSIMGGSRFGRSQKALIAWMDSEGAAPQFIKEIEWDKLDYGSVGQDVRDKFEEPVAKFFINKTKAELYKECVKRGVAMFPANTAREILDEAQLAIRNYWVKVPHPELGSDIRFPGAFFKSSEASWEIKRRAPLIGEHNEEIYTKELGFSKEDFIMLKQNAII